MTVNKYLTYWCSNDNWWDYDENGNPVVLETAPQEAKESYKCYLEHENKYGRCVEQKKIETE